MSGTLQNAINRYLTQCAHPTAIQTPLVVTLWWIVDGEDAKRRNFLGSAEWKRKMGRVGGEQRKVPQLET